MKKTPGFTAEKSLYRAAGGYQTTHARQAAHGGVTPAGPWGSIYFRPFVPSLIGGYLFTRICCRNCANECAKKCFDSSCYQYCLTTLCNPKCDAYTYGGCAALL
jgi:hypothetical protein